MKFFIAIISFLLLYSYSSGQRFIKTTEPCTDEILKNVKGEWIHWGDPWYAKVSKQQEQEIRSRVATIHQFIYNLLPSSIPGIDAAWGIHSSDYEFAQQSTREQVTADQSRQKFFNGIPLVQYTYSIGFYEYSCGISGNNYLMRKGYPREDGAGFRVAVNTLNRFIRTDLQDVEGMQIDGRNIKSMPDIIGSWKGYTLYHCEQLGTAVLLHRDGILPYMPVTRKQYLELSIKHFERFFDETIKTYDELGDLIDKKTKDENIKRDQKQRDEFLNYYRKEIESTTKAGLLDSPAITPAVLPSFPGFPIFITLEAGGHLMVTENSKYFRKDLPKYIPQLFILSIEKMKWWFIPKIDPITTILESFPIEKLQAMIDK